MNNAAGTWNDFNDADAQQSGFDVIPKGTVVPVRMTLKPGGHDDHSQGWNGGYPIMSPTWSCANEAICWISGNVAMRVKVNYGSRRKWRGSCSQS